jgi:hypothetical protein
MLKKMKTKWINNLIKNKTANNKVKMNNQVKTKKYK